MSKPTAAVWIVRDAAAAGHLASFKEVRVFMPGDDPAPLVGKPVIPVRSSNELFDLEWQLAAADALAEGGADVRDWDRTAVELAQGPEPSELEETVGFLYEEARRAIVTALEKPTLPKGLEATFARCGADPEPCDGGFDSRCAACKSATRTLHYWESGGKPELRCDNGCHPEHIVEAAIQLVLSDHKLPPVPVVPRLAVITDVELEAKNIPPLRWIIPGVLPEGLSILVGNPKAGKSALALGWAYALAAGLPVMGALDADPCEALCLFLEDNERRVRDRVRLLRGQHQPVPRLRYVTKSTRPPFPRLGAGAEELLEAHLDAYPETRLLVVDTWVRVKPASKGRAELYDADSKAWSILHDFSSARRVGVLALHHTNKAIRPDGDWINEISGSTGVAGIVDTILLLKRARGESVATLKITGREHDEDAELFLKGNPKTKAWALSAENPETARLSLAQKEIVRVLTLQPYLWPREIEDALGKKGGTSGVRNTLLRMQEKGRVLVDSRGKYYIPAYLKNQIESDESNSSNKSNSSNGSNGQGVTASQSSSPLPPSRSLLQVHEFDEVPF